MLCCSAQGLCVVIPGAGHQVQEPADSLIAVVGAVVGAECAACGELDEEAFVGLGLDAGQSVVPGTVQGAGEEAVGPEWTVANGPG